MPEKQQERVYRLFPLSETLDLADLNPGIQISPNNVGQKITIPVREKQQTPNNRWTTDPKRPNSLCNLFEGRMGSVIVSIPAGLTVKQARPDLWYHGRGEKLFYPDQYYEKKDYVVPRTDATIPDGRLERVQEITLMDQHIHDIRSAAIDAIRRRTKTAHLVINHPWREHFITDGHLTIFRDKVEEQMIAAIINDVREHKTLDEVLEDRTCTELGSPTERALRQEWAEQIRKVQQAFELHGLKSFKFRLFPPEIPIKSN